MVEQQLAVIFSDIKKYSTIKSDRIYSLIHNELNKFIADHLQHDEHAIFYKKSGDGLLICATNCLFAANVALKLRDRFLSINWKEQDFSGAVIPRIAAHFGMISLHRDELSKKVEDVCGNNVIYTARIEPITPPAAVYCSKVFYDQLIDIEKNNIKGIAKGEVDLAKDFGKREVYELHWEHERA